LKPGLSGVGVFAIDPIPKKTNPFKQPFKRPSPTISFTASELKSLPAPVKDIFHDFIHPVDSKYDIPKYGRSQQLGHFILFSSNPSITVMHSAKGQSRHTTKWFSLCAWTLVHTTRKYGLLHPFTVNP
jgi:hypothetical protein